MNYPRSPRSSQSLPPVTEELLLNAIVEVIQAARSQNRSLEDVKAEVLAEDRLLDAKQRQWLSEIVMQAWKTLPERD